jgi:amino acid transporter, AAT family
MKLTLNQGPRGETNPQAFETIELERGLARELTARQLAMMAIGGAIGTGLFLGSSLAVRLAGPGIIVTYLLGALVALLLMSALAEMAVAHPTAGSFGVYAEIYVSRWAGFAVRYTYWAVQSIAIGGEATAVAIYCQWWFPGTPAWAWIMFFSALLIYVNTRAVGSFGEFEYWFSLIKVVAIVLFIVFGVAVLSGLAGSHPAIGLKNYRGFFPHGLKGAWMALVFVIYSYIGTEVIAVAAGETRDPAKTVPRAVRSMVARLIALYVGSMVVLVGIVPWRQIQPGADVTTSPFVRLFELIGVPAAAHLVNFVVLTAALSSMNCNLYLNARMMFSLARSGYAPERFGRVSVRGTPLEALLASAAGMVLATVVAFFFPRSAYVILFGISLFGGLFAWIMIFVTHLYFRSRWRAQEATGTRSPVKMPGYPYTSLLGLALMLAILLTTWWVEGMRSTLRAGLPWLAFVSAVYAIWARRTSNRQSAPRS